MNIKITHTHTICSWRALFNALSRQYLVFPKLLVHLRIRPVGTSVWDLSY
jgi:hypothetical protein